MPIRPGLLCLLQRAVRRTGASVAVGAALALTACSPSPAPPTGQAAREARTHLVEVAAAVRGPVERVSVHTGTLKARRLLRVFTQEEGRI
ncbi:MAG: hypothetical protein MUC79_14170, partial [Thiobacillaceae bacterium]|nr:hypothetical protein [Thiobacillaceae bacterium]